MRIVRLCVALGSLGLAGVAQTPLTLASSPKETARPISALLGQLRQHERISVTYEDPRYSKRSDMDGKPAEFSYMPADLRTPDSAEATVARMLREYGASGGLTFAVVREGVRLHVVPSETVNVAGQRVRQDSILDTVISVPAGRRTTNQLLQIDVGSSDPSGRNWTRQIVDRETARAAIESLLDSLATPGDFVWDLYYDPADRTYGLNFSYIGSAGPVAK